MHFTFRGYKFCFRTLYWLNFEFWLIIDTYIHICAILPWIMQIWVILKDANCASAPCIDKLLILILYWLYIWYSVLNLCNLAMYLMSSKLGYHPQNPRKSGKIPRKVAKSPEKWLKKSHCLTLARIACEVKKSAWSWMVDIQQLKL